MSYKIPSKPLLPFISNENLYKHVKDVLDVAQHASDLAIKNLYSNVVDPFSAIFDALRQEITLIDWIEQETARQMQKTMQNALGNFHQAVIGSMNEWENLSVGHVVDVCNKKRKIVAEIKNKHNTTKGSDKKSIYDNLNSQLDSSYEGFTGYYVEIIPKSKNSYNKVFTPSDNVTRERRPINEKIRVIDGGSFYALASGHKEALKMLYVVLPKVIADILEVDNKNVTDDDLFTELFDRVY